MSESSSSSIPVTLKWSKQTFALAIHPGESAVSFKDRVEALTGVPVHRQKLLAKGGWKGTLRDDAVLGNNNNTLLSTTPKLTVTLIGSAEKLQELPKDERPTFVEDLSADDLRAAEQAELEASMATAEGMIVPLQHPPHLRDDGKQEVYSYNRLVTGLPQRQIEDLLRQRQRKRRQGESSSASPILEGRVAMTLGAELRRAYVNDLAVLANGTLVSANDDGHVQLWRHGALEHDEVHLGGEGGVDSVVALANEHTTFATAGRGCVRLWTADAEPVLALPGAMPGTTPSSLVSLSSLGKGVTCLAARFHITRYSNPNQFRLPPQNEEERRRRAQAEAHELAIQQSLARASRSVQVWSSVDDKNTSTSLRSQILHSPEGSAPITTLVALPGKDDDDSTSLLIAGDALGGLRLWRAQRVGNEIQFHHQQLLQLVPASSYHQTCSIVCIEALQDGRLAVSTEGAAVDGPALLLSGATEISIPLSRAVYVLDYLPNNIDGNYFTIHAILNGHQDAVRCMCELPNGDLLTGGGKMDATLQLWTSAYLKSPATSSTSTQEQEETQVLVQSKAEKTLGDVGYVFSLAVLPDAKADSNHFAVAAARYNTVKLIL
jgi:WD40 repeat protein